MNYTQLQNSNKPPNDNNKRTVMELFRNIKLNFQDVCTSLILVRKIERLKYRGITGARTTT